VFVYRTFISTPSAPHVSISTLTPPLSRRPPVMKSARGTCDSVEEDDMLSAVRRRDHDAIHLTDASYHEQVNEVVDGESPMSVAAKLGSWDTLELLYSLGGDPGQPVDEDGKTPLFVLISECPPRLRAPCLKLMLGWSGVEIDAMCDLQTPLEYLGSLGSKRIRIHSGDLASMKQLILSGAHVGQGTVTNVDTRDRLIAWAEGELDSNLHPPEVVTRLHRCHSILMTELEWECCYLERGPCAVA